MAVLERKRNKFRVSSRLLTLSRRMSAERHTKGTAEELQADAKRQLSDFQMLRARANSTAENDAPAEPN
jgi:hypothetical protein